MSKNNDKKKETEIQESKSGTPKNNRKRGVVCTDSTSHYDARTTNDFSYYNRDPQFIEATAGRVSNAVISGVPYTYPTSLDGSLSGTFVAPGIMTVDIINTIGSCRNSTDPVNRAYQRMYAYICSKASGAVNDLMAADLAIYGSAAASIIYLIGMAKRAIETRNLYATMNRYYPRVLHSALGFGDDSYDDLIGNAPLYIGKLNTIIRDFNSIHVVNFTDIFGLQYSMAHNVYIDNANDIRGQLTVLRPINYYTISEDGSTCVNNLIDYSANTRFTNVEELLTLITELISKLRNSAVFNFIQSYYERAYDMADFVVLDMMTELDILLPIPDKNIMDRIHNMRTMPLSIIDEETLNITQNVQDNALIFDPKTQPFTSDVQALNVQSQYILDSYDGEFTTEFVTEATRLVSFLDDYDESTNTFRIIANPEIATAFNIYVATNAGHAYAYGPYQTRISYSADGVSEGEFAGVLLLAANCSAWHAAPRIEIFEGSIYRGAVAELNSFGFISNQQLKGIFEAIINSLYMVL